MRRGPSAPEEASGRFDAEKSILFRRDQIQRRRSPAPCVGPQANAAITPLLRPLATRHGNGAAIRRPIVPGGAWRVCAARNCRVQAAQLAMDLRWAKPPLLE